jgi:hypothetical protein
VLLVSPLQQQQQQQQQQQVGTALVAPCFIAASTTLVSGRRRLLSITVSSSSNSRSSLLQGPALLQGGLGAALLHASRQTLITGTCMCMRVHVPVINVWREACSSAASPGLPLALLGQLQVLGVDTVVVSLVGRRGQCRERLIIDVGEFLWGYVAAGQHSSSSIASTGQGLGLGGTHPSSALPLLPGGKCSPVGRLPALLCPALATAPAQQRQQRVSASRPPRLALTTAPSMGLIANAITPHSRWQVKQQRLRQLPWAVSLATYAMVQAVWLRRGRPTSLGVGFLPCVDVWHMAARTLVPNSSRRRVNKGGSLDGVVTSMTLRSSRLQYLSMWSAAAATATATISSRISNSSSCVAEEDRRALLQSVTQQVSCLASGLCHAATVRPWSSLVSLHLLPVWSSMHTSWVTAAQAALTPAPSPSCCCCILQVARDHAGAAAVLHVAADAGLQVAPGALPQPQQQVPPAPAPALPANSVAAATAAVAAACSGLEPAAPKVSQRHCGACTLDPCHLDILTWSPWHMAVCVCLVGVHIGMAV